MVTLTRALLDNQGLHRYIGARPGTTNDEEREEFFTTQVSDRYAHTGWTVCNPGGIPSVPDGQTPGVVVFLPRTAPPHD